MMLDRMEGNAELKTSVQQMLATRRLTHSVLLVGEAGLGTGFAARCIAADYLYPVGGAAAEALLRGECCRAVAKAGKRDSGTVETGIVREAISVSGMGSGGKYLVGQVTAMRSEIFNTSLSAEGRAVLLYHVERMNEESANALLKVMEEPPEGVLFLLTADSLASVLPTIRSRCVSFAVAPVSPADCTRYCAAQGVDKKTAALYSELFDGHIGTVLAVARDEARAAQVEKALELARAAAARDSYTAAVLLAAYEKDKAAAAALLTDFRAVAAAGLRSSPRAPVQGTQARQAVRLADAALQRLGAQVNPKVVLTVFAAKVGFDLCRAHLLDDPGGHAHRHRIVRDDHALRHKRPCPDDAVFAHHAVVQQCGVHPDQTAVPYGAAVHQCAVPYRDVFAKGHAAANVAVQHRVVLHVAVFADGQRAVIAAQHRAVPDGGAGL